MSGQETTGNLSLGPHLIEQEGDLLRGQIPEPQDSFTQIVLHQKQTWFLEHDCSKDKNNWLLCDNNSLEAVKVDFKRLGKK